MSSRRSGWSAAGTGPARRRIRPPPHRALDRDELGVSALLQTPGRLDDGTQLDYAWGLGVRTHAGCRIYRHGGRWAGLNAQLIRVVDRRSSFVIVALDDDEDRTVSLANALIEELTS